MGGNFKTRYCQAKSPVHSSLSPSLIHRHTYLGHRIPFEEKTTRDLVWQQTHQLTSPFPNPEKHHKGEPSAFSTTRSKSFPTKHTSRRARAHCRKSPQPGSRAATGGHREDRRSRPGAQGHPGAAHRRCGSTRATNQPASARRQATLRARSNDMRPCRRPSDHTAGWLGLDGRWGRMGEIKTGGVSRRFLMEGRKASIQSTYLSIFLFFAYRTSLSEQLPTPFSDRGISSTTTHHTHIQNAFFSTKKQADAAH